MQRTPAQSAERRDPATEQRGQSAEQRSPNEELREKGLNPYDTWCGRPFTHFGQQTLDKFCTIREETQRSLLHLKSQTRALREAVTKAKEKSIKRQLDFLNSAFNEYQSICAKVLEKHDVLGVIWNEKATLLDWMTGEGREVYEEAMSWVDDFFERQEKEKAAQETEALKAAKAQELQRLADNLIEDEMDAHGKVSDAENLVTGGPEDADELQDKIEDLELTLKKLQKLLLN
jgi:hypothetical protein